MAGLKPTTADVMIGRRMAEARRSVRVTQKQAGAAIGVSYAQLQKYEKGVNRISAVQLLQFARATDTTIGYLSGETVGGPPPPDVSSEIRKHIERVAELLAPPKGE